MAGDGVAIDALALLAEPFDEGRGVDDLAARFRERLPLLGRHQLRQAFLVLDHQLVELAQDGGALLAGACAPIGQPALASPDSAACPAGPHLPPPPPAGTF